MSENAEKVLYKAMEYCADTAIESLAYETSEMKIVITKPGAKRTESPSIDRNAKETNAPTVTAIETSGDEQIKTGHTIICSTMNGVFYKSSDPQKPSLVKIGDKVKVGDVLGLVEVMKCFIEIKSEISGVLTDVLVSNEVMIEHGQPLFEIRSEDK